MALKYSKRTRKLNYRALNETSILEMFASEEGRTLHIHTSSRLGKEEKISEDTEGILFNII